MGDVVGGGEVNVEIGEVSVNAIDGVGVAD